MHAVPTLTNTMKLRRGECEKPRLAVMYTVSQSIDADAARSSRATRR